MDQNQEGSKLFFQILKSKFFLSLCLVLIVLDSLYPVSFTWDSGHYFSYLKVLSGTLPFSAWDPVRGIIFPLYLQIITVLFGRTSYSLLLPMIFFHLIFFWLAVYLVIRASNSISIVKQRWLIFLVFIFIAIDPLIMGFYHNILTEFMASFIAILSCLFAYLLFKKAENDGKILVFFTIFSFLVSIAWHLKQPYFGAAFFPLILASFLICIIYRKRSFVLRVIGGNLLVLFVLGASILAWNQVLPEYGEAANPDRNISSYLDNALIQNVNLFKSSPEKFIKNYAKNYLALSNIYYWDANIYYSDQKFVIEKTFSITRARENGSIGYRTFSREGSNLSGVPEIYLEDIHSYETAYNPPKYLNDLLLLTTSKSNILFSILFLTLPVSFILIFVLVFFRKILSDRSIIIYLCSGSALLNALEHAAINIPIDRYLFWGYPLLLLSFLLLILYIFEFISAHLVTWHTKKKLNRSI